MKKRFDFTLYSARRSDGNAAKYGARTAVIQCFTTGLRCANGNADSRSVATSLDKFLKSGLIRTLQKYPLYTPE